MLICDTHADTLCARTKHWNDGVYDVRREWLMQPEHTRVQAMALFIPPKGMEQTPTIVDEQLEELQRMKAEGFHQIRTLDEALPGQPNIMLTIEGGEAFGDRVEGVDAMAAQGVRLAALTWNTPNALGQPALVGNDTGIKPFGWQAVRRMQQLHMAVDVSHLNVRGFWDLLDHDVRPMASHSCAWALCPNERNLTDDQLRALFETDGFVGVNFYAGFLSPECKADIDLLIDHMAHMCELGGEHCVGFGSDFDGIDAYPEGLRTANDVPKLIDRLLARGFGQNLTEQIAGLNFKRYLESI